MSTDEDRRDRQKPKPQSREIWFVVASGLIVILFKLTVEGFFIAWHPIAIQELASRGTGGEGWIERNIAVVDGTFKKDTLVSASLFVVRSGKANEFNSFKFGRDPAELGKPIWMNLRTTLSLIEYDDGGVGELRSSAERQDAQSNPLDSKIKVVAAKTLPGKLARGRDFILHVEGDRPFNVSSDMSVDDFAKTNNGNFLVVVVKLL